MGNVRYIEKPRFKRPKAVAGFPGIANIGKLAVDFMVYRLGAKKFAEIFSEHLPEWGLPENGDMRSMEVDLYYCLPKGANYHLILVTADAQATSPVGQYILCDEIVEILERIGTEMVGSMAAYAAGSGEGRKSVIGVATTERALDILKRAGIEILSEGVIVGMNGLLPAMAALRGIDGFCILGVTRGDRIIDPVASDAVIKSVSNILGFRVDSSELLEQFRGLGAGIARPLGEEETKYIG